MNKCIDCGKNISKLAKRCRIHANIKKSFKHGKATKTNHCIDCNKLILGYFKRCLKCLIKFRKGSNNPNWRGGLYNNNYCKCGNHITYGRKRCWNCWRKELSKLYKGKNNPAYINGKSHAPYPLKWTEELRELIRERDNYKCTICHKYGKDVHHIDYNKQNCSKNNLITLCRKHHGNTSHNRDYWYTYFTYIMEN